MKKLLGATAVLAALVPLAACSGDSDSSGDAEPTGSVSSDETTEAAPVDVPDTASQAYCTQLKEFDEKFASEFGPEDADQAAPLLGDMAELASGLATEAPEGLAVYWEGIQASLESSAEEVPGKLTDTSGLSGTAAEDAAVDNLVVVMQAVAISLPTRDGAPELYENAETACGVQLS